MNDNPHRPPTGDLSEPVRVFEVDARRPFSISMVAWILIMDGLWRAIALREYKRLAEVPPEVLVLSFTIFGCYVVSGWGFLERRKWAVLVYFAAHTVTIERSIQAYQQGTVTDPNLALVRLLWNTMIPILIVGVIFPRWGRMRW